MSNLNHFARRANEIAHNSFEAYDKGLFRFQVAQEKHRKLNQPVGTVTPELAAKRARADADLYEATAARNAAQNGIADAVEELKKLRSELVAAVGEEFAAKPEAVDNAAITLLQSGILSSSEYVRLMREASANGNYTLYRLYGAFAGKEAKRIAAKNGDNDPDAKVLRVCENESKQLGSMQLKAFDYLTDVLHRCAQNPDMISHWEELTAAVVEEF